MSPQPQVSQLLPSVLQHVVEGQRVTVLDVGPALPETVAFFSAVPCTLHIADLFSALPLTPEDDGPSYIEQFRKLLPLPAATRFDICLFWDLFNYLPVAAASALLEVLHPHLHADTRGHAFGVHKRGTPEDSRIHGILNADTLTLRSRRQLLPGYAPMPQAQLQTVLADFRFERSVLLADSRLEFLLGMRQEKREKRT
ncbi:hypothetical protein Q6D67_14425 [Haliea sp. E1-2-M8]|uniref:hypothetical protein n=1 Tax=Haliea sp. E1-2-M8 TaxID=3064706 RepID=UPI00271EE131|nr:hypothetical protein [Haliea sp. E1-2-M8]MDO8862904.1 hypothetical protein [Haliea sp. E1-2-M8]